MNRAVKVIVVLFVLFVVALGGAVYFFMQYRKAQLSPNDANAIASAEEVSRIVGLVSQHVVLPEDETPTVALVTSVEELKDQPFFKNAENGYQVLVYQQTGFAVLYDPARDLVVNMAQINPVPPQEQQTVDEATQTEEPATEEPQDGTEVIE